VIAEVIGGILLGPSVMGRVPGFTNAIFPNASIPNLTLVANIGLVLFLFLVGLEVDLRYFVSNWRVALSVGAAGMALPFGLGWAIAVGLYKEFHGESGTVPIAFGTYALFIAVALSITAFPVLCRILTELKLLSTPVGIIVLSAGVSNDVIGWILLALCVALVNAGSGLTALWILLVCLGYALFLGFAVRPAFMWILRKTRALQDGPSQGIVCLTLMIALTSAFFTGVIGVHPIFGAFMAGLICPHEGGFAIKVTEKVEDLVGAVFLPLYFALSGLSTNLGLLNTGITWGYVIAVIAVAFCAKFAGGTFAAKLNGLVWRESFTIGVLMSCKGLVELIVLNIGLQAKILSQRTFTIFVVMALVTTFATTPLTAWLYPPWYQRKIEAWKREEIDWDTGAPKGDGTSEVDIVAAEKLESAKVRSLLVYLRLDNMPTLLALVSLFGGTPNSAEERKHPSRIMSPEDGRAPEFGGSKRPVEVHGMRLIELTERGSTVMKVSEVDEYSIFDPVINAFRVLGQLYSLAVSGEVAVVPESSFADTLVSKASDESSDLLLVPWSETGSLSEVQTITTDSVQNKLTSEAYASFVTRALNKAQCNTAVFVNKGFSGSLKSRPSHLQRSFSQISIRSHHDHVVANHDRSHHIFLPFFGGADDKVAVRLVLQLAENPEVTATVVYLTSRTGSSDSGAHSSGAGVEQATVTGKGVVAASAESDAAFFATMQRSVPTELQGRIVFNTVTALNPVQDALAKAQEEVGQNPRNGGDLVVLGRNKTAQTTNICLGDAASAILDSGLRASILVVQAKVD
jgi:Kef-type K+ transport system membrane component KefB